MNLNKKPIKENKICKFSEGPPFTSTVNIVDPNQLNFNSTTIYMKQLDKKVNDPNSIQNKLSSEILFSSSKLKEKIDFKDFNNLSKAKSSQTMCTYFQDDLKKRANSKLNPTFTFFNSNSEMTDSSTQTDLSYNDVLKLENLNKLLSLRIMDNDLRNLTPSELRNFNQFLFPKLENQKTKTKNQNIYNVNNIENINYNITNNKKGNLVNKKLSKKNNSDIKIFNSVVFNNNDCINKNFKKILKTDSCLLNTQLGTEIYSSKVIDLLSKEDSEEASTSDIYNLIDKMREKNSIIDSDQFNSIFSINKKQIRQNISNLYLNKNEQKDKDELNTNSKNFTSNNLFSIESKLPSLYKNYSKSLRKKSLLSKTKNINEELGLKLNEKYQHDENEKEIANNINYQSVDESLKKNKKYFDPFNFFLKEFKQNNPSLNEILLESEARNQWNILDKDTKKIYNIHADREKKLEKQNKRLINKEEDLNIINLEKEEL